MRVNSTANPLSRWRTTRPCTLPSVTSVPMDGRWPVGEPGQLRRDHVAFAQGRRDCHRETIVEMTRDQALHPAQMVDIGDDPLTLPAGHGRDQRHAARRHVQDLTRIFLAVGQHVATEQMHLHALKAAAFLCVGQHPCG